jgi:hypothetical protein
MKISAMPRSSDAERRTKLVSGQCLLRRLLEIRELTAPN